MFRVFYSNFGYFSHGEFLTFDLAVAQARKAGFQSSIYYGETLVGAWCPIAGSKTYPEMK
jgi:hypothetical protein